MFNTVKLTIQSCIYIQEWGWVNNSFCFLVSVLLCWQARNASYMYILLHSWEFPWSMLVYGEYSCEYPGRYSALSPSPSLSLFLPPSLTPVAWSPRPAEATAAATTATTTAETSTTATGGKEQTHSNALGQRTVQQQIQGKILRIKREI